MVVATIKILTNFSESILNRKEQDKIFLFSFLLLKDKGGGGGKGSKKKKKRPPTYYLKTSSRHLCPWYALPKFSVASLHADPR